MRAAVAELKLTDHPFLSEGEHKREEKQHTIVGFFCGTGYDAHTDVNPRYTDMAFQQLTEAIETNDHTKVYNYSGCHKHGGGIFATGVDIPCHDLYDKIIHSVTATGKIKLHLIAQSRGCMSVFMLVKKINANPTLKDKVEIVLDLRDPVPGNLLMTPKIDVAEAAIATQLKDLRECENVKEVNITLDEFTPPAGFSALVPEFHLDTRLNVEITPSSHGSQRRKGSTEYQLATLKSLELLHVNNVSLKNKALDLNTLRQDQLELYNDHLEECNTQPKKIKNRDLHFGGKFKKNTALPFGIKFSSINPRHAELQNQPNLRPAYLYQGDRPDIKHSHALNRQIRLLMENEKRKKSLIEQIELPNAILQQGQSLHIQLYQALIFSHTKSLADNIDWIRNFLEIEAKTAADVNYIRSQLLLTVRTREKMGSATQDLIEALEQFSFLRDEKKKRDKSEYGSFFGRITGMSATLKSRAAETLAEIVRGRKDLVLTSDQIKALKDGTLGELISHYYHCLPNQIKEQLRHSNKEFHHSYTVAKLS